MWSDMYKNLANRNMGLLNEQQQDTLRNSCVAICGLGGLGGPISEMLCRLGIGSFRLLDRGHFELSNSNRQNFSFLDTDGRLKTDVTEEYLLKINPEVKTEKCLELDEDNVHDFLAGTDAVVLSVDSVMPCLLASREARRLEIPLIEGWAMAFGNVRVFTKDTPTLEEAYNFPTIGREISSITAKEEDQLMLQSLETLGDQIQGIGDYYDDSDRQRLEEKNEGTTLCPCVWLTCAMMANETMKVLLDWGNLALAPSFAVYDGFSHQIPSHVHS